MPETNTSCSTADATPAATDQAPPLVVQVRVEDLRQAVHDAIVELRKDAVANSKNAIVDAITLPFRAAKDWLHWLTFGDCDPNAFGKPAGSKPWPTAKGQASEPSQQS